MAELTFGAHSLRALQALTHVEDQWQSFRLKTARNTFIPGGEHFRARYLELTAPSCRLAYRLWS
jgi:hypothetical protein